MTGYSRARALPPHITHEAYIHAIRSAVLDRAPTDAKRSLSACKLVYGSGRSGTRGTTYFQAWKNGDPTAHSFVEVCASGEESDVQIAGTTVHELAHVLAGHTAGHGPQWKNACKVLGLASAEAAGQNYAVEHFDPTVWAKIAALDVPNDGLPFRRAGSPTGGSDPLAGLLGLLGGAPRPCGLGIGTRGGTSRGKGSGSRLRLWHCDCATPVKVRVASDEFAATCKHCGADFHRA